MAIRADAASVHFQGRVRTGTALPVIGPTSFTKGPQKNDYRWQPIISITTDKSTLRAVFFRSFFGLLIV